MNTGFPNHPASITPGSPQFFSSDRRIAGNGNGVAKKPWKSTDFRRFYHQDFQVPKMEVLNLIRLFWQWGFPYISLTYSLYIGENLHFRYLKCSVILVNLHRQQREKIYNPTCENWWTRSPELYTVANVLRDACFSHFLSVKIRE